MDEDTKAKLEEMQGRLDREFKREIPWFKARFAAISADPMTAGFVALLTFLATKYGATVYGWVA